MSSLVLGDNVDVCNDDDHDDDDDDDHDFTFGLESTVQEMCALSCSW